MKNCINVTVWLLIAVGTTANADLITAPNALREIGGSPFADAYTRGGSTVAGHSALTLDSIFKTGTNFDSGILVFNLPTIPVGHTITSANLTTFGLTVNAKAAHHLAVDLYGVRFAAETASTSDAEVLTSDAETSRAFSLTGNNGTGIMENFYPESNVLNTGSSFSTDTAAQTALANWLTEQISAGAVTGDYLFLRLSPGEFTGSATSRGWKTNSADSTNAPVLTITTSVVSVPEPSAFLFMALAGCLSFRRFLV